MSTCVTCFRYIFKIDFFRGLLFWLLTVLLCFPDEFHNNRTGAAVGHDGFNSIVIYVLKENCIAHCICLFSNRWELFDTYFVLSRCLSYLNVLGMCGAYCSFMAFPISIMFPRFACVIHPPGCATDLQKIRHSIAVKGHRIFLEALCSAIWLLAYDNSKWQFHKT